MGHWHKASVLRKREGSERVEHFDGDQHEGHRGNHHRGYYQRRKSEIPRLASWEYVTRGEPSPLRLRLEKNHVYAK